MGVFSCSSIFSICMQIYSALSTGLSVFVLLPFLSLFWMETYISLAPDYFTACISSLTIRKKGSSDSQTCYQHLTFWQHSAALNKMFTETQNTVPVRVPCLSYQCGNHLPLLICLCYMARMLICDGIVLFFISYMYWVCILL